MPVDLAIRTVGGYVVNTSLPVPGWTRVPAVELEDDTTIAALFGVDSRNDSLCECGSWPAERQTQSTNPHIRHLVGFTPNYTEGLNGCGQLPRNSGSMAWVRLASHALRSCSPASCRSASP